MVLHIHLYIYCNTQGNTPPWTIFKAGFLDKGESSNAERCVRLRKVLEKISPKTPFFAIFAIFGIFGTFAVVAIFLFVLFSLSASPKIGSEIYPRGCVTSSVGRYVRFAQKSSRKIVAPNFLTATIFGGKIYWDLVVVWDNSGSSIGCCWLTGIHHTTGIVPVRACTLG